MTNPTPPTNPSPEKPWQGSLDLCKAFLAEHGRLPHTAGAPEERRLANWLHSRTSPCLPKFDHDLSIWFKGSKAGLAAVDRWALAKAFHAEHGQFPSPFGKTPEERKLGAWLAQVCNPSSRTFIPQVREWRESIRRGI